MKGTGGKIKNYICLLDMFQEMPLSNIVVLHVSFGVLAQDTLLLILTRLQVLLLLLMPFCFLSLFLMYLLGNLKQVSCGLLLKVFLDCENRINCGDNNI